MWYAVAAICGLVLGVGGGWWYWGAKAKPPTPPPPDPVPCPELQGAVEQLHQVLFAPYGTIVTSMFNDVWEAAGLEPKGVPNINNGRT